MEKEYYRNLPDFPIKEILLKEGERLLGVRSGQRNN
jgi:hypothetical protein